MRPQPHAIWLPMAHFRSTLPYLVSLSGWVQGLLTVWLPGWVLCHQLSPPPTSVSLHVHPSTTLILFCSSPCSRGPLLQPLQAAALDLCKSGVPLPSPFPVCSHRTEFIRGPVNLVLFISPGQQKGGLTWHRGNLNWEGRGRFGDYLWISFICSLSSFAVANPNLMGSEASAVSGASRDPL